jgi:hypothetical protein
MPLRFAAVFRIQVSRATASGTRRSCSSIATGGFPGTAKRSPPTPRPSKRPSASRSSSKSCATVTAVIALEFARAAVSRASWLSARSTRAAYAASTSVCGPSGSGAGMVVRRVAGFQAATSFVTCATNSGSRAASAAVIVVGVRCAGCRPRAHASAARSARVVSSVTGTVGAVEENRGTYDDSENVAGTWIIVLEPTPDTVVGSA